MDNGQRKASPQERPDSVPDAGTPSAMPDEWGSSEVWGGEATVPAGNYGPPIPSELPDARSVTRELRELERRVRARLTPAFPIDRRRPLPLEFLWRRYRELAMQGRSIHVDEFGRDPVYEARVEPVMDFLYRRYFRTELSGVEHLPTRGPAILVANHTGPLPYDAAVLMHALKVDGGGRQLRVLMEDAIAHLPYLGTFLTRLGAVRACPENAERLLAQGERVAVFPEGLQGLTKLYSERQTLKRFGRGGFVKLALSTGVPLYPVAIVGAAEAQPMLARLSRFTRPLGLPYLPVTPTFPLLGPLGLLPLPSKWTIRIGPRVEFQSDSSPGDAEDRLLVSELAAKIRDQIDAMIKEISSSRS